MREVPRKTQNLAIDFLVSEHEAQFKSANTFRCSVESKGKNRLDQEPN